jgi:CDP-diglyceride synthetase
MVSDYSAREAQYRETLPPWATQPLPLGLRHRDAATEAQQRPVVVRHVRSQAMPHPVVRPRAAGSYLPWLVALFAFLNAADLFSTFVGLQNGLHEGNPLMASLLTRYGFIALIVYKALVVLAVALGVRVLRSFRLSVAHVTIWICNILVFTVVLLNILQYALILKA